MNQQQNNKLELKLDKDLLSRAKIDLLKKRECLEIVQEIRRFGISDAQRIEIVHLLCLEFENREYMEIMHNAVKQIKGNDVILAKIDKY